MEGSSPAEQGDVAQLLSPFIFMIPDELYCLNFWYHMHGNGIGGLQGTVS